MELNKLSGKLDAIGKSELGIHFEEALVWDKIGGRIAASQGSFRKKFFLAACLTLLILLIPIKSTKNETGSVTHGMEDQVTIGPTSQPAPKLEIINRELAPSGRRKLLATFDVVPKGVDLGLVHLSLFEAPKMEPVELSVLVQAEKNHFMSEDISKIQSTLEKPERKNQLKISVKAEVYTSSRNAGSGAEKFKIKLNGKN